MNMKTDLKLRCCVLGNQKEIGILAPLSTPCGGFASGSHDGTVRIWFPKTEDVGFSEKFVLHVSDNRVAAVCHLPSTDSHQQGLLMVANDNSCIIHAYTFDSNEPVYQLAGHTGAVCSLASGKFGSLVSGSLDKTARVWVKQKCVMVLQGHEGAVWSVVIMPEGGRMLTGSEDKSVKMWKAGKTERTFLGHTAGVRCVAVLNAHEILSYGDDGTMRLWSTVDGTCTMHSEGGGHVRCLTPLLIGTDFVTGCDDGMLTVWRQSGLLKQHIAVTRQAAVTAVCMISDGDIVVGTSDSTICVFTSNDQRFASDVEQKSFSESVFRLKTDGTQDCVNDASTNSQSVGLTKQVFNGKEYDFVFDVELFKDKPPLKLPYNIGTNPRDAASTFLECYEIDPQLLEQATDFIKDRLANKPVKQLMLPAATVSTGAKSKTTVSLPGNEFFPETVYIRYDQFNPHQIFNKIREFNDQAEKRSCRQFKLDDISVVESLVNGRCRPLSLPTAVDLLRQMLQWPAAFLFPVLDAFRLAVRQPVVNGHFCTAAYVSQSQDMSFADYVCNILNGRSHPKNQLLMLRVLCNVFQQPTGEQWALENANVLLSTALATLREATEKPMQVALSSFLLNLTIAHRAAAAATNDLTGVRQCILTATSLSQDQSDGEAHFRLLVAIGTAMVGIDELVELTKTLDLQNFLYWCVAEGCDKTKQCSRLLNVSLQSEPVESRHDGGEQRVAKSVSTQVE